MLQLVDRSYITPLGIIVEDVLVQVGELFFLVELYIMQMNGQPIRPSPTILLGRPFLETTKAIINVEQGSLSVGFNGDVFSFNIFNGMKFSKEHLSCVLLSCTIWLMRLL